ncbi:helix-hairpin-helix domain-containing protein [Algoriphagus sp. CAU 1675]|uniref:ComEA family DNA-binding protein n=1 Tax=Algoriphagus sp. CAU 1675 TaxID=3032597 RepID=UPI0023DAD46F|nr:helix-hairpin-helix domain-containing protein [Algoriphagus sp. CAU 1675]MDF2158162.1 helix-hairpin-helix domain-containing protein [Algoriphagus sp. CAU 1675]
MAQSPPIPEINQEELIERLFPIQDEEMDYESVYEMLLQLYLNPININFADSETLQSTYLLSPTQINNLIQYRQVNGPLISLYELQAIPGFDLETIEKLLPFVIIESSPQKTKRFIERLKSEEQSYFLFRHRKVWENRRGFLPPDTSRNGTLSTRYLGDPNDLYLRFRVQHSRDFSIGFTMDKDAGEQFIWDRKTARFGFNFLSYHFTRYEVGKWKTISIGDFQASFGQGLVFGAGYSLGKGAETVPIVKRNTNGIIPYTASMEFGFFRGIGTTYSHKNWLFSLIASNTSRDGRGSVSLDSLENEFNHINSFNQSGLHRTPSEISTKRQFREYNLGTNIQYLHRSGKFNSGINYLMTKFDRSWIRDPRPYNHFEFAGQINQIGSIYSNFSWKNFLFFGESGISKSGGMGSVFGFISSLNPKIDFSLLWRKYDRDFHSFYGNSFSEGTRPINEQGTYLGLEIRPAKQWKVNGYFDFFRFPWLKYRLYAPSSGHEMLLRLAFSPRKDLRAFIQIREEQKDRNLSDSGEPSLPYRVTTLKKLNGLISLEYNIYKNLFWRSRILFSRVNDQFAITRGFMVLQDLNFKKERWKITGRFALFDTDNYDTRIYAFENNVLWTFSIPAFSGQGQRYYLLGEFDLNPKITAYLRFAKTSYTDRESIGTGLQTIEGTGITETTFLIRYFLNR